MKKILAAALFFAHTITSAQVITVAEQTSTFSTGQQPAIVTTCFNNSLKDVTNSWTTYMKSLKSKKVTAGKEETFTDNVLIKDWGNNPVDIYARFEENKADNSVKVMVAFDLGGAYLSSTVDATKYSTAEQMVKNFAVETTKAPIQSQLKDAEKLLGKMESDRGSLEKDIKSLRSDVEKYKDNIKKAEDDAYKKENDLSKKKSEIDSQRTAIQLLTSKLGEIK